MARPREFDRDQALSAAIALFREHGFEGTSASMLTGAMKIGRQSLYDTFGDKWQLYCASVQRYAENETRAHLAALNGPPEAFDGLEAMIQRVVAEARRPCLGIGSICEFGRSNEQLSAIHDAAAATLRVALSRRVSEAQAAGRIAPDVEPMEMADFLLAHVAAIRIAARGGADDAHLAALRRLAFRALR
ncbi:TetR/AcrR family transcriptional regulator [Ancylobacter oerskovii]|uniref:TetR/AcrR family transcriptional regulator n=1 Tax=Ancylobacter oerskovii TaxID=459519 RepID=A0ABW4Z1Y6_9HYPH|nr:TetR/AcrR family transcriptional regulator [Ancylobacter oerskovii]MBS7544886.1 TetR/AcrR family transcriptional regulator [Ancylobacter oerskovii]